MRWRRKLLKAALGKVAFSIVNIAKAEAPITLALLHLASRPGEVGHNKRLVEEAIGRISAAAIDGAVMFSHASPDSAVILVDWDPPSRRLANWRVVG